MTHYTELEQKVILAFDVAFNYRDAQSEKDDNATALNARDIHRRTGMDMNQAKGVMSSLHKKGLLQEWGDDLPGNSFITEAGIDAHYALKQVA